MYVYVIKLKNMYVYVIYNHQISFCDNASTINTSNTNCIPSLTELIEYV